VNRDVENMTHGEKCAISLECKTNISAMLTDKIDLDFFEIRWLCFVLGGSLGKGMVGLVGSLDEIQVLVWFSEEKAEFT